MRGEVQVRGTEMYYWTDGEGTGGLVRVAVQDQRVRTQ